EAVASRAPRPAVLSQPHRETDIRLRTVLSDRYKCSGAELQDRLETNRASLRRASALAPVALHGRRGLYREDVAEVIEQYQVESRKYRRAHNSLQFLVMVGSTTITTIAALDAKQ
ncbi:hypothetical protein ACFRQM_50410, partial [Streptomyces sp. NPDC056831]|uniref:hypothetical protein n=1 Tax=Streptomyces sp. NPDC056831 TaxID=3345954 RepID=UPI0036A017CA